MIVTVGMRRMAGSKVSLSATLLNVLASISIYYSVELIEKGLGL